MSLHTWLLFVSLAGAVIAAPGPSALLCVTHAARHGVRPALATIVGGMTASMTLMGLSALGLGAVIAASDTLFHIIKWAGAAYLLYLGIATWRSQGSGAADDAAVQTAANASPGAQDHQQADRSMWRTWRPLYRKGLIVGIGNPKDLLSFSALFPQFMDDTEASNCELALFFNRILLSKCEAIWVYTARVSAGVRAEIE